MGNKLTRAVMITRCRYGMPGVEVLSSLIGAIPLTSMPWDGHIVALVSSLETIPHQYKFGKHPDFGYTLRLTCEKENTPYFLSAPCQVSSKLLRGFRWLSSSYGLSALNWPCSH